MEAKHLLPERFTTAPRATQREETRQDHVSPLNQVNKMGHYI